MTEAARIPCINPRCRRTAPADRYGPDTDIVCGKCFRMLPAPLRNRYRQLSRRDRRLQRRIALRLSRGDIGRQTIERVHDTLEHAQQENWRRIRSYFVAPARPIGLEGFLQEVGL